MSILQDGHLDEGTIHAWLDGALDARSAAEARAHVSSCASCSAVVAEARGLVAGASRIVRALDDAPVTPVAMGEGAATSAPARVGAAAAGGAVTAPGSGSLWRLLRVTPSRAAIAATLLVAVGVFATRKELGRDSGVVVSPTVATTGARGGAPNSAAPGAAGGVTTAQSPAAPPSQAREIAPLQDSVLRSAIRRRLEATQPPRTVERAPGVAIPETPPPAPLSQDIAEVTPVAEAPRAPATSGGTATKSAARASAPVATAAALGVAGGRAMAAQARDSASGLSADQSRARVMGKVAAARTSPSATAILSAPVINAPTAASLRPSFTTGGLAGDWRGESTCRVHVPICEDEPVVYHVVGSPSGYQLVMNRQRGTVEEYFALLECVLTAEGMECPTELGVWRFRVAGNEMTGEFTGKDGVVVRGVKVVRDKE